MIKTYYGPMESQIHSIQNESIDLLLTDPPYNISDNGANPVWIDKETGKNKNSIHNQNFGEKFDENWDIVDHEKFLEQFNIWSDLWYQKIRKGGSFVIFMSDQYISFLWKAMKESGFAPKRIFTWKKPAAVPFNRNVNPVSGCEYILWGIKPRGKRTFNSNTNYGSIVDRYSLADKISSIMYRHIKNNINKKEIDSIFSEVKEETKKLINNRKIDNNKVQTVIPNNITFSGGLNRNKIHPTQKPVEILEYFIELLTNSNNLVLDCFAGSGSTGIACRNLNRNCILIEKDKKMFELMNKQFIITNEII